MSSDSDDLDPFSASFSPSRALSLPPNTLCSTLPTPRDRAIFTKSAPLNNLSACATLLTAPYRILKPKPITAPAPTQPPLHRQISLPLKRPLPSQQQQYDDDGNDGKHNQHRDAIGLPCTSVNHAPKSGILQCMHQRLASTSGPMQMLQHAVSGARRVRIRLRETHRVGGEVVGTLVAFDRHFNMVVRGAVVTSVDGGRRRVGHVLLRGENVVWVAMCT